VARDAILTSYLGLLAAAESPLALADASVQAQVREQLYGVIDAVAGRLGLIDATTEGPLGETLSEAIGRSRATSRIHPSQSLQAATLIFEAALPIMTDRLIAMTVPHPTASAAVELNREILHRMAVAARGYVDYLLDKAESTNRDERRRLSRELHDVAAPAVALGLQNLELFDAYSESDPDRATDKIHAARQSLIDALATIRGLSAHSRASVGELGLSAAINRYLDTLPSGIGRSLTAVGDIETIPLPYAEELFLIVREAARNAVDHGEPATLTIRIAVGAASIQATIHDDGSGFDVGRTLRAGRHIGIDSMYERSELLGASLALHSRANAGPGSGTTVELTIPTAQSLRATRTGAP
jgi:signal transduction histidine kinase